MRPRRPPLPPRLAPDRRPAVCPGCCGALIRGRRARPGHLCPECLHERAVEIAARAKP